MGTFKKSILSVKFSGKTNFRGFLGFFWSCVFFKARNFDSVDFRFYMNFHCRYQGFPRKYPWLFILAFLTSWNFYPWKYKISAVHPRNFLGIFWYLYLRDFLRIFPPGNPGRGWDSFMKKDMRTKICLLSGDGYFVILENGNCTKKAIGYKKYTNYKMTPV